MLACEIFPVIKKQRVLRAAAILLKDELSRFPMRGRQLLQFLNEMNCL